MGDGGERKGASEVQGGSRAKGTGERRELGSVLIGHGPQKGWWEGWGWLWRRAGRRGEAASGLGHRFTLGPTAVTPTEAWEMSLEKLSRRKNLIAYFLLMNFRVFRIRKMWMLIHNLQRKERVKKNTHQETWCGMCNSGCSQCRGLPSNAKFIGTLPGLWL